ncbi:MAG: hypothetical protein LBU13_11340 [Synergistaceae bacterium]|nr:hypothetical protein [Synergistaceae bacterium]
MPLKRSFRTKLRRMWVPKEFRLPEPEFTKEQLDLLEELIQTISLKIGGTRAAAPAVHLEQKNISSDS